MTAIAGELSALTAADFERFRDFFYRQTGIFFAESKRYYVDKRIATCVREEGYPSFGAWFAALRLGGDAAIVQRMVNRMTVNETYFFRERHQFDLLVRHVLPRLLAERPGGPIRILSLPCSSGEEPYSIALTLLEEWPALSEVDVEICGADVDTHVLTAAVEASYGAHALQHVAPGHLERYFRATGQGRYQLHGELRESVAFSSANVCDRTSMRRLHNFDVVFCRNLLIYFDELSCRLAAENLFDALRPGGYLFLGHSESMSRISNIFDPVRFPEGVVYHRPGRAS